MRYTSTRSKEVDCSFEEALTLGYAPDGGLFVPKTTTTGGTSGTVSQTTTRPASPRGSGPLFLSRIAVHRLATLYRRPRSFRYRTAARLRRGAHWIYGSKGRRSDCRTPRGRPLLHCRTLSRPHVLFQRLWIARRDWFFGSVCHQTTTKDDSLGLNNGRHWASGASSRGRLELTAG